MKSQYKEEVIEPGDQASKLAHKICIGSFGNCPAVRIIPQQAGNFRGQVDFNWSKQILIEMLRDEMDQTVQNDGAGGKPQFFTLLGTKQVFYGLGWEIIEMCAEDIVRGGRFPAVMINDINFKRISWENHPLVESLLRGYGAALKTAKLVNITGEIAVMKNSITAFCDTGEDNQLILTWGGACIGLKHKDKVIDGSKIEPKMPLVGLYEDGYRCNGGGFFTDLLLLLSRVSVKTHGAEAVRIWKEQFGDFIKELVIPSKNYSRTVTRVHGWHADGSVSKAMAEIRGIAHITGGGIWGKFREMLPKGVGAHLSSMPDPPHVLREGQEMSWKTEMVMFDWDAYEITHGGVGMVLACASKADAKTLIAEAHKDNIRAGIIGETTESKKNEVVIESKFREGRTLSSEQQ